MTRSVMEAPADGEYGSVRDWCRSPAQPVTKLIGSTNPSLHTARPKPAKSDIEACVRRRSDSGIAGIYLRVSGP
ncbi:hypothetical protein CSN29_19995 [Salmonella enterica subsp. diarizonae]|nr:hypothetical protein [Salmonella enterica]ECC3883117.1 hypothetical protein [Salmonella enterica subsp. diarizonae]ECJ4779899.1 hypothetical protein [Salmonella enterica subsp. diarizonae]ECQ2680746.1 hypothetical protein [Salmonella enterica]EDQ7408301.1 hypothetical protein [Salmonella enterica subsp. diarizonae]